MVDWYWTFNAYSAKNKVHIIIKKLKLRKNVGSWECGNQLSELFADITSKSMPCMHIVFLNNIMLTCFTLIKIGKKKTYMSWISGIYWNCIWISKVYMHSFTQKFIYYWENKKKEIL